MLSESPAAFVSPVFRSLAGPARELRLFYGWPLVVVLGITTTISFGTTAYLVGVLIVPISAELGWSRATISGAYAVAQILAGLAGVPIGGLVDRYGARVLMSVGSLLGGSTLIALSRVTEPWQFYVLWAARSASRWR